MRMYSNRFLISRWHVELLGEILESLNQLIGVIVEEMIQGAAKG